MLSYHTISEAYILYLNESYTDMNINLAFGLSSGMVSFWLFYTAFSKGMREFIDMIMPNGFGDAIKELEIRLEDKKKELEDKKKKISDLESDVEYNDENDDE
jgi:hypothetical protein